MRFTNKDTLGLALAACAVVLLVLHGRAPHTAGGAAAYEVEVGTSAHAELADADSEVIAFVNVQLPGTAHSNSLSGVVVVHRGVVSEVGPAEEVDVPAEAAVIDGEGSTYLVASTSAAGSSTWVPISEGLATDLLLLAEDPRDSSGSVLVQGRLTRGHWSPDVRAAGALGVPAGH